MTGYHDATRPSPAARGHRRITDGIPYLAPEDPLFYKAKNLRLKDGTDFTAVLPFLARAQRRWLSDALARTYGEHPAKPALPGSSSRQRTNRMTWDVLGQDSGVTDGAAR